MLVFRLTMVTSFVHFFFFSSRRRHTRFDCDWSSDVCSSDLYPPAWRGDIITARSRKAAHRGDHWFSGLLLKFRDRLVDIIRGKHLTTWRVQIGRASCRERV